FFFKENTNAKGTNISLEGKHAGICRSTRKIGLAIEHTLASLGATCILLARNENKLRNIVETLPNAYRQHHSYEVADLADLDGVARAINRIADSYPVEILINNTVGPNPGLLMEAAIPAFELAFRQ